MTSTRPCRATSSWQATCARFGVRSVTACRRFHILGVLEDMPGCLFLDIPTHCTVPLRRYADVHFILDDVITAQWVPDLAFLPCWTLLHLRRLERCRDYDTVRGGRREREQDEKRIEIGEQKSLFSWVLTSHFASPLCMPF